MTKKNVKTQPRKLKIGFIYDSLEDLRFPYYPIFENSAYETHLHYIPQNSFLSDNDSVRILENLHFHLKYKQMKFKSVQVGYEIADLTADVYFVDGLRGHCSEVLATLREQNIPAFLASTVSLFKSEAVQKGFSLLESVVDNSCDHKTYTSVFNNFLRTINRRNI